MNDINLLYSQKELIALGLGIADSSIDDESIVAWINDHKGTES